MTKPICASLMNQVHEAALIWSGARAERIEDSRRARYRTGRVASPRADILIVVPGVRMGPGWDRRRVTLFLEVSEMFPHVEPQHFMTGELHLADGSFVPSNRGHRQAPEVGRRRTLFFLQPASWSPRNDDLISWVGLCAAKLATVAEEELS